MASYPMNVGIIPVFLSLSRLPNRETHAHISQLKLTLRCSTLTQTNSFSVFSLSLFLWSADTQTPLSPTATHSLIFSLSLSLSLTHSALYLHLSVPIGTTLIPCKKLAWGHQAGVTAKQGWGGGKITPSLHRFFLILLWTVWPDWAIFCTFGNHSKPVATIILGNFCKVVKIIHFSIEIIFGQLL